MNLHEMDGGIPGIFDQTPGHFDQCDMCEEELVTERAGLHIEGSDIFTRWAGGNGANKKDPFTNHGKHAPMQGQVSLTVCTACLKKYLEL